MESVGSAEPEAIQLRIGLFANVLGRLDFSPRRKQIAQSLFGGAIGGAAEVPIGP